MTLALMACFTAGAQSGDSDVFIPISKYITRGDADALSAWFGSNLDISVLGNGGNSSKNQAKQILRSFFESYTPRSFRITYTAGRANMKYAIGTLNAGGESFLVTIFVSAKGDSYYIQQLKVERVQ